MSDDTTIEGRPVDHDALERVLVAHVEGCTGLVSLERLSGGASQETYRIMATVDGAEVPLAMRRAPGGVTVEHEHGTQPGLDVEAALMRVAAAAGVPEPVVHHIAEPGDGIGDGFIMEWLDGETLGARIVRSPDLDAVRPGLARQCGEILARIHAIDLDAAGLTERLDRVDPAGFVELMWQRYRAFATPQPMIDYTARWLLANLPDSGAPTLVHNDFRNGNIMVDATSGIVAVLDWEAAHIGDPMRDLGWLCTNSWRFGRRDLAVGGFGEVDDLVAGYESVSGSAVDRERLRWWEVFGSYWWAVGCLAMADHYRTGPDRTVERPGIGRRSSECQVDCVNLIIPGPVDLIEPAGVDDVDMPRIDELLGSVRDFLHGDVMDATTGRTGFLARVAGNSLDIVAREIAIGPEHRRRQIEQLSAVLGSHSASLGELRRDLVDRLRDDAIALDHPGLVEHLRSAVVNQVAIDQPRYSGFVHAAAVR